MDIEERIENAKRVLGNGVRVVKQRKPGTKKKTKPVSAFIPRKTKGRRNMSRSEYEQCGKKTRYATEADARKFAAKLSEQRGYSIRVYGPCPLCGGGFHLTHQPYKKSKKPEK